MKLFCGDAICKKPVVADLDKAKPWPVRCDACGTSLYPGDVLSDSRPDDLEPKRGELMTEKDGKRVPISSSELGAGDAKRDASPASRIDPPDDDEVDRLMNMVEHEHVRDVVDRTAEKRSTRLWVISAVIVMVLGTLAWAMGWID